MRILYDSKLTAHKDPFGTLTPGQKCKICVHVPATVEALDLTCHLLREDGSPMDNFTLGKTGTKGPYALFSGIMTFENRGLYFYYFTAIFP